MIRRVAQIPWNFGVDHARFAMAENWPLVLKVTERRSNGESTDWKGNQAATADSSGVLVAELGARAHVVTKSRGEFAFDLAVPPGIQVDLDSYFRIEVRCQAQTQPVAYLSFSCAWRGAEVPVVVERLKSTPRREEGYERDERPFRLAWSQIDPRWEFILVEAVQDEADANWFPIMRFPSTERPCTLVHMVRTDIQYPYDGKLKFRVVPISSKRP